METSATERIRPKKETEISRRDLLRLGWGAFWAFVGVWLAATARFFFPRVLFEPATAFRAGFPDEYAVGTVDTRFQKTQRVWIVRETDGFYALSAKCTHLGCTPVWSDSENKFKCPCHGSGFTKEGINYEGPAPRPLERLRVALADDGQLAIESAVRYRYERGEWERPGAFLNFKG
ncbi:MAG: Rieske 2Fe-2S domain-containing protein [Acidobacteriota bacterium]